ncbi:sporulation integral membrane protein YlbJ [Desulfosporosinus sp.]|uniref:sporulation integral membrane protein YlbJ n=1 Tax=Desulfosporosinus sp. TaxID=157907 RepID=UPI000E937C00|nr:sporulation integral membrane protein YlbJ [Desulfosporosinus sp.]MBC2721189.1 sporulation integral membrane protein YlbJ [Desulfosporosinus sp.]MBC2728215.1 sporulation integral membrane protein YlbJ [Desulfosporosinus sp.]HBV85826.1 sporulation integral membrane protein YlbJ [Desulfosporosinus sp.]
MSNVARVLTLSLLALGMFIYPQEVLSSAGGGLTLWWRFVLPALLPFFILSELLMASGFVHFLGVLLESFMRPVFRLPGKAAFVVAMGYTSGFPMGAVLTARLRNDGEITREEGERLLAFTNNPSPGFMFGAVASGMLGKPALGILLAGSVYLANLIVGFLFRFYRVTPNSQQSSTFPSFKRAWREMKNAQNRDTRTFGQVLGDAIKQSTNTVLMVAGFMAFFSVILRLLNLWHIPLLLATIGHSIIRIIQIPVLQALFNGLFEMTLGCQEAIQALSLLDQQVALLSLLMGWGGLSVFAQVAGLISGTDLRFSSFLIARTLHALIALGLSQLFLFVAKVPASTIPVQLPDPSAYFWNTWHLSSYVFIGCMFLLVVLALIRFRPS